MRSFLHRQRDARIAAELDRRDDGLAFDLHAQRVLVGAGDDVDRVADQRLSDWEPPLKSLISTLSPCSLKWPSFSASASGR